MILSIAKVWVKVMVNSVLIRVGVGVTINTIVQIRVRVISRPWVGIKSRQGYSKD